ncbi:MAG: ABC transporter ATP-binding protein/permease [Oscillospiraceae bacterium]|jgi:ABC-type multidrug transport system fused ATPase/permease subunit|nr:ABC transporter ATP-binding protein/permease [Oscillospiraceae bacterium]
MKMLWRIAREAKRYRRLLIIAALSTLLLTLVNLAAPRVLTRMTALVEAGVDEAALRAIGLLAGLLLLLYMLRVLFRFLSNYLSHAAAWRCVQDLRMKVYNRIQSFSPGFFHDKQTGDLMSRVVNDTAEFELLYAHIMPESITNLVTWIGVTIILFTMNARLALLTCIPIPFILASGWVLTHKVRPNFRAMRKNTAALNAQLQDNFSGIREIQAFGQQAFESRRVEEKASGVTKSMLRALKLSGIFHPSVEFLTSLGTVFVVGFGGLLAFHGEMSVSEIVGFLLYLTLFYAPITGLAQLLENAQQALAGAERVLEILDARSDVRDQPGAKPLPASRGEVRFEGVDFAYVPGQPVLMGIDFTVKPGQMVALVGPTGVGKTTLTQLLARFYDPSAGRILVDGHDLRDVTGDSLHQQMGMVLQDTFLFNGSVAENIAYARPDSSREAIIDAAKRAQIYQDILQMTDGLDTQVGERGTKLSGGQKQRIAIARAILRDAPILILDEATASVDMQTELQIQQAIQGLTGSRTIFAIAHRLSTIRRADIILVFEDGRIVQRGTHEELAAQEGLYRTLCQVQAGA